jgi:hypothetical protein
MRFHGEFLRVTPLGLNGTSGALLVKDDVLARKNCGWATLVAPPVKH